MPLCCHSGDARLLPGHGLQPQTGQRIKQEDTPHLAALGSWSVWVTGHVTPSTQWPDLSEDTSWTQETTPIWLIKDLSTIFFQKPQEMNHPEISGTLEQFKFKLSLGCHEEGRVVKDSHLGGKKYH